MLDRTRQRLTCQEVKALLDRMFEFKENYISVEIFLGSIPDRDKALYQHKEFVATGILPHPVIEFCNKRLTEGAGADVQ